MMKWFRTIRLPIKNSSSIRITQINETICAARAETMAAERIAEMANSTAELQSLGFYRSCLHFHHFHYCYILLAARNFYLSTTHVERITCSYLYYTITYWTLPMGGVQANLNSG